MKSRADSILSRVKGPRVLDVGCAGHTIEIGSPQWLHGRLDEAYPDLHGIDVSRENIEALRNHGFRNLHLQSAENFDLKERFDTIVAGELIEHLSNPGLFLDCARRHLTPGGRLVLTTPSPFSLFSFLYALIKYPKTCENPQHTAWFCLRTLSELVGRHGLKVREMELIPDYYPDNPSRPYRTFVKLIGALGPLIPSRLRNNAILAVLEPLEDPATTGKSA